jgi:putative PepSY-like beta-lactamase-inhibitor
MRSVFHRMLVCGLVLIPAVASAEGHRGHGGRNTCPASITDAATKAAPGAKVVGCHQGSDRSRVFLENTDGSKVELTLSAKGDVEGRGEDMPLASVPAAVTKAFAARYPSTAASKAERVTKADKSVVFEISAGKRKDMTRATFKADGTLLEEEAAVPASALPPAVAKAFAARYPGANAWRVEKRTSAGKATTFELGFKTDKGRTKATFKDDGTFVKEHAPIDRGS